MNDPRSGVVLSCLGVPVETGPTLAVTCRHLPRTEAAPVASVSASGPAGVADLTRAAVDRTDLLALHACVAAGREGLIAIPGPSGLGKSTLSLALLGAGLHHVSDEVLAIDRLTRRVTAFPRPVSVDSRSWAVLGLPGPPPAAGAEAIVDPGEHGIVGDSGGSVRDIVIARRGDEPSPVVRASASTVLTALIPRCFNHHRDARSSLDLLAAVTSRARLWQVTYREAPELAERIRTLVGVPD